MLMLLHLAMRLQGFDLSPSLTTGEDEKSSLNPPMSTTHRVTNTLYTCTVLIQSTVYNVYDYTCILLYKLFVSDNPHYVFRYGLLGLISNPRIPFRLRTANAKSKGLFNLEIFLLKWNYFQES